MKYFLKKIFIFFIITGMVSIGLKIFINKFSNYKYSFKVAETTTNLILGHSQTECAFNDNYIQSTQNFSQGAEAYLYTYLKLKKLVNSNTQIKNVFLSFSNNQIEREMDKWIWSDKYMINIYPKYSFLMSKEEYRVLINKNMFSFLKSELRSIKFFLGNLKNKNKDFLEERRWGGYLELKREKLDSLLKLNKKYPNKKIDEISETNIDYLVKIRDFCKEKHIKLFLLRTPIHPGFQFLKNEGKFIGVKNDLFPEIEFLDFKDFPLENVEFGDYHHLNHKGAKRFSFFFNSLIKEGMLNSNNKQEYINDKIQEGVKKN